MDQKNSVLDDKEAGKSEPNENQKKESLELRRSIMCTRCKTVIQSKFRFISPTVPTEENKNATQPHVVQKDSSSRSKTSTRHSGKAPAQQPIGKNRYSYVSGSKNQKKGSLPNGSSKRSTIDCLCWACFSLIRDPKMWKVKAQKNQSYATQTTEQENTPMSREQWMDKFKSVWRPKDSQHTQHPHKATHLHAVNTTNDIKDTLSSKDNLSHKDIFGTRGDKETFDVSFTVACSECAIVSIVGFVFSIEIDKKVEYYCWPCFRLHYEQNESTIMAHSALLKAGGVQWNDTYLHDSVKASHPDVVKQSESNAKPKEKSTSKVNATTIHDGYLSGNRSGNRSGDRRDMNDSTVMLTRREAVFMMSTMFYRSLYDAYGYEFANMISVRRCITEVALVLCGWERLDHNASDWMYGLLNPVNSTVLKKWSMLSSPCMTHLCVGDLPSNNGFVVNTIIPDLIRTLPSAKNQIPQVYCFPCSSSKTSQIGKTIRLQRLWKSDDVDAVNPNLLLIGRWHTSTSTTTSSAVGTAMSLWSGETPISSMTPMTHVSIEPLQQAQQQAERAQSGPLGTNECKCKVPDRFPGIENYDLMPESWMFDTLNTFLTMVADREVISMSNVSGGIPLKKHKIRMAVCCTNHGTINKTVSEIEKDTRPTIESILSVFNSYPNIREFVDLFILFDYLGVMYSVFQAMPYGMYSFVQGKLCSVYDTTVETNYIYTELKRKFPNAHVQQSRGKKSSNQTSQESVFEKTLFNDPDEKSNTLRSIDIEARRKTVRNVHAMFILSSIQAVWSQMESSETWNNFLLEWSMVVHTTDSKLTIRVKNTILSKHIHPSIYRFRFPKQIK